MNENVKPNYKTNDFSYLQNYFPKHGYGPNLVMFAIAQEGWNRGLKLTFHSVYVNKRIKVRYTLAQGETEYRFQLSLSDKCEPDARRIGKSKELTKEFLEKANVSTPKGDVFSTTDSLEKVLDLGDKVGFPLVIKPTESSLGKGVVSNIKNKDELTKAFNDLNDGKEMDVIIEQYINGEDTRIYVIEDKVIAAYKRHPANVIGDGKKTIQELVEHKNKLRQINPHASAYQIEMSPNMEAFLEKQGYSLNTIPELGQQVFLSNSTLHPDACEVVDITDDLSDEIKSLAINAVKAIPGMNLCGVDVMIDKDSGKGYVLELNSRPNIGGHLLPMEGKPRGVHQAIIDYYFPETVSTQERPFSFSFDFDLIFDQLKAGIMKEITLPTITASEMGFHQVKLTGDVNHKKWITSNALGRRLSVNFLEKSKNELTFLVAGKVDNLEEFMQALQNKTSTKTNVTIMDTDKLDQPIMIGSTEIGSDEIEEKEAKESVKPTVVKNNKKNHQELEAKYNELERKYKAMLESKSWKYTKFFRKRS